LARADLPSGTVTFLFTDVEGSTRLLHELGAAAYAEALAEHRRVIREICAVEGGVEVDTQGDAFFFAFPSAAGALAAASALTDALAAGPIQVRVGLHTGTPLLTGEGYVGDDVHFAARVAASSHGGQVVLSAATRASIPASNSLLQALSDLGEHRLKDIAQAVSIYQLGEGSFPPLKTISNTNLPRPASSFLGRQKELAEVLDRIDQGARLLTLTGPGGTGKTRLALEAAATLVPAYKAGVFWVGLASLRDPALVPETIAQVLGAKDSLAEHIGERELSLLLDNLEQVIEVAPALSELLSACPNLTMLVTSRELLRVQGEVEYAVPPLATPEAVDLFCARSGLAPSEEIAQLCARLDSLPLAVELAAARTKALSVSRILERLSGRLDLLKGGRDADPRQQTLRATIEWSYDLLSPEEQALFARLSVFAGGCTLEAAEEVAGADLDTLQRLVEKSLLRFSNERYWMLETIREYAGDLMGDATYADDLYRRHAAHYACVAAEAGAALDRGRQSAWLERLDRDHDNVRAAIDWAVTNGEPQLGVDLVGRLWRFWVMRGNVLEGRTWLERALALPSIRDDVACARALDGLAYLTAVSGDGPAAVPLSDRSVHLWRKADDRVGLARSLSVRQTVLGELGDEEAVRLACEETIRVARDAGVQDALATSLNNLADQYLIAGDYVEAQRLCEESIEIHRARGDVYDLGGALVNAGHAALAQQQLAVAGARYGEALRILHTTGAPEVVALLVGIVGTLAESCGNPGTAARLVGSSQALAVQAEAARTWPYEDSLLQATLGRLRDALRPLELERALEEGATMSTDAAIELALAVAKGAEFNAGQDLD
jgi:predicted ATPase/class 3 adenylate cyclase